MKKTCTNCGVLKDIEEFYLRTDKKYVSGFRRVSWCKSCLTVKNSEYRLKNRDKLRIKQRQISEIRRVLEKDKWLARQLVQSAVRGGRLKQLPCARCGDKKSQAHHHDYTLPLDVVWLCKKHHYEEHRRKSNVL